MFYSVFSVMPLRYISTNIYTQARYVIILEFRIKLLKSFEIPSGRWCTMISAYIWNYFPHLQKSVDLSTSFIKNLSSSWINLMALKLFFLIYFLQYIWKYFFKCKILWKLNIWNWFKEIIALTKIWCGSQNLPTWLYFATWNL